MGAGSGSVLVTGGLGCLGAWTVRELLLAGIPVVVFDPSTEYGRLRRIAGGDASERVPVVGGDISDLTAIERTVVDHGVDRIVHLAALQVPSCRADPATGAIVNVLGSVNVFEAARRAGISGVVYTSSIAIFDQRGGRVAADAIPRPASHYGAYKLANEGTARAYWTDFGVSSIGIRPMTVYGPGRDRGLTSSPTKAILAGVLGCRYEIGFGGTTFFHHAADVGRALVGALDTTTEGAHVVNLNGVRASIGEVLGVIREVAGSDGGGVTARTEPLPFPDDVDTAGLELIGHPSVTPLREGITATAEFFRDLRERGLLEPEDHGLAVRDGVAVDRELTPTTR